MNNLDGKLPIVATVHIDRHSPPQEELIGSFVFTDMAEAAAVGICERYHYRTIVRFTDTSYKPIVFEWKRKSVDAVVRVRP